ncbi:hypothetical protein A0256_01355 [Mucilaginibacter sp. PAMC 26640]|nr:hypothetical protein A0256_01355 [Mucilaginibacter sp. PAMC 26640]
MVSQTLKPFNVFELKGCREIPAALVDTELANAEQRLENWENKSYYQKVASLAKIADLLPDQSGKLSLLIKEETDHLLAQSYRDIALL